MNHDLIIHFALLFIEIQTGFTIQANFYGRFDIERNDNDDCNNDYVKVRFNWFFDGMILRACDKLLYLSEITKIIVVFLSVL